MDYTDSSVLGLVVMFVLTFGSDIATMFFASSLILFHGTFVFQMELKQKNRFCQSCYCSRGRGKCHPWLGHFCVVGGLCGAMYPSNDRTVQQPDMTAAPKQVFAKRKGT